MQTPKEKSTVAACIDSESLQIQLGPFTLEPCVTLYLLVDGAPINSRLLIQTKATPKYNLARMMVRVFNPNEELIFWRHIEYIDPATVADVPSHPDIELRPPESLKSGEGGVLNIPLAFNMAGVYQVRIARGISGDEEPLTAMLQLSRNLEYGICCQNGTFRPWGGAPDLLFVYVPCHAEELRVKGKHLTITTPNCETRLGDQYDQECGLIVTATDTVWRFHFNSNSTDAGFAAAGFPLILCSTEEAARRIQASVEILSDGTVVCHKFQQRIAELLPRLLAPENVGQTSAIIRPLASCKEGWLANPLRNRFLIEGFLPTVEKWLNEQNLDPNSHWGGSLQGWKEKVGLSLPENRWDRFKSVPGLYAGASLGYGGGAEHLARAALHNDPANPYFSRRELLYRAAAAALRDLMALGEDEVWRGVGADMSPDPSWMAFPVGGKTFPVFGLAAPHLPDEVRAIWTEGLRHIIDRSYPDALVTCRNQSSFYLVAFEAFANGTDDPRYRTLARLYARRFVAGQNPAGWHMELIGPDASYTGMTHWHMAVYYRMSNDPAILESLRRSYRFFNYTVAPEPGGRMLGGFNFNHRIGAGFYFEQYNGAKGIADDTCPEIGLWADLEGRWVQTDEAKCKAVAEITGFLEKPVVPVYADQNNWHYLGWAAPDQKGTLPALAELPFIHLIEDQLVAVKRPAYYAVCFVGKPGREVAIIENGENLRSHIPAEDTGGEANIYKITPFIGGGLSNFWTPDYGHALVGANWAPTTHHGLVATKSEGKRYWEDYAAHTFVLDPDQGELTISGQLEKVSLCYERKYRFGPDAMDVELTLTACETLELGGLVENIPVALGDRKIYGADMQAGGVSYGGVIAERVVLRNNKGAGVEILLDAPCQLRLVPNGLQVKDWHNLQIGRIEIVLPVKFLQGSTTTLHYHLRPLFKGMDVVE